MGTVDTTVTIVCPVCKVEKTRGEFPSDRVTLCKKCYSKKDKEYKRSLVGHLTKVYSNQKTSSRRRGHPLPNYSLKEFREWALNNPKYVELWEAWEDSNFDRDLAPSFDRLDDSKPYTFDNMQIVTAIENLRKQSWQRVEGTAKNDVCKPVIMTDLDGNFIAEYHSVAEASRCNPGCHNISEVIAGTNGRTQTNGFKFRFKEKK